MNKVVFGLLTLFFNFVGVPNFIVGNKKAGIITIVLSLCTCGIFWFINWIMGIIAAIKIFTMSDEDYEAADKATLVKCIPGTKKA